MGLATARPIRSSTSGDRQLTFWKYAIMRDLAAHAILMGHPMTREQRNHLTCEIVELEVSLELLSEEERNAK